MSLRSLWNCRRIEHAKLRYDDAKGLDRRSSLQALAILICSGEVTATQIPKNGCIYAKPKGTETQWTLKAAFRDSKSGAYFSKASLELTRFRAGKGAPLLVKPSSVDNFDGL